MQSYRKLVKIVHRVPNILHPVSPVNSFHHDKITLYPSPFQTLLKEITMCRPHLRSGELCSTSLKVEYLHKLFEILLQKRLVSTPPPIYFLSHLLR